MTHGQRDAQPELKITRIIQAPRQVVFDAWMTAESLREWMCPAGASVSFFDMEVRVGSAFRIEFSHEGEALVLTGIYQEILPPEKLIFTWLSKHTHFQTSLVTVEFLARGEHTKLVLTQRQLPDAEAVRRHRGGWTTLLDQLVALLQQRGPRHTNHQ